MKKAGFNEYVYDFSVDYDAPDVDDIADIHNYLMKENMEQMKIFRFVKKVFFTGLPILSNFTNAIPLSCISMKNQEYKKILQVANFNSNNPIFYPFSIKTSKYSGNCNKINNPYANICVPDVIKDFNVKDFNLMIYRMA